MKTAFLQTAAIKKKTDNVIDLHLTMRNQNDAIFLYFMAK
jgi:hypothetical protein